jgi:hypothetical protein
MIVLHKHDMEAFETKVECWTNLKGLCKAHNFPYWTLIRLEFPFDYNGWLFFKVNKNQES